MGILMIVALVLSCLVVSGQQPSNVELGEVKCGQDEFAEVRQNYVRCANEKIAEIIAWLEQDPDGQLNSMCMAVHKLVHTCGDELGWCFTADQVEETKATQRAGIEQMLRSRIPVYEAIESCLHAQHTPPPSLVSPSLHDQQSLMVKQPEQ